MFSKRVPGDLRPNALARLRARRGADPFDLTLSNPTECGIEYPGDLLDGLTAEAALRYRPEPRGSAAARAAVAAEYRRRGTDVEPDRVVLTASTSEAYSFLFRLLCDPGDRVLIPAPSYPLFEHLAALDGVRVSPYALDPDNDWQPDLAGLREATAADAAVPRAVVVVHPNNPTGTPVLEPAAGALLDLSGERAIPLIVDEVFLDYPLGGAGLPGSFAGVTDALVFTLGGLSKSVGLPQLKLAWIVVCGPDRQAVPALERLEFVADQFLSVGTPVQHVLPRLLAAGAAVRAAILERCRCNLTVLAEEAGALPALRISTPRGGWSAVLRFPNVVDEEALVLELLERDGVAVHPGYFFDFPRPGYLVLSLLPEPERFREGVRRLVERVRSHLGSPDP